jgi:hypothetical protein
MNRNDSTIIAIKETPSKYFINLSDLGFFYNCLYKIIYNKIKCVELAKQMTLVIYIIENYNQMPNRTDKLENRKTTER